MGRSAKQIAADLDRTRARLDSSLSTLRREASPWKLAKLGLSRDWVAMGTKAQEAFRSFMSGRHAGS